MRFSIYQESKKGNRKSNQDRMGYCFTRQALLMVLADGMGGHLQGDIAAQIAVQTIGSHFQRAAKPRLKNPLIFLEESLLAAHREIHHYRVINQMSEAPRTTIVVCVVQRGMAYWAHAGDSRLYWLRNGAILAQTRDHSVLQSLIDQGRASRADLEKHPDRNQVLNCLGSPSPPVIELSRKMPLKPGDTIFLCSDGLWSAVSKQTISDTFAGRTVMRAVPDLIYLALLQAAEGADNVTGLAMTWEGADYSDDPAYISTLQLPPGAMTTTIHPRRAALDLDQETLSEDEIEQAIEEIRASISRSSAAKNKA